jgi:hypothetical protein
MIRLTATALLASSLLLEQGRVAGEDAGPAVTPARPLEGYATPEALRATLRSIAQGHGTLAELVEIGRTAGGRPIDALRLGPSGAPALLVVAGLHGNLPVGPETAVRVAELLATQHAERFASHALWIVPMVDIDALHRTFATPGAPTSRSSRAIDEDRDGTADEDGPSDLNGDGVVTTMRVLDPAPPFAPALVSDDEDPRLLRPPNSLRGERPRYRLLLEGLDVDGDGVINEDPPGGVDLDRNFMHRWPEFELDAGPWPLSEPESLALARFVLAHPELAAALTFGRHDTLARPLEARGADLNPRVPLTIDQADNALYAELSRLFRESTGQSRAPSIDAAGAFHAWLYNQRGIPSMATILWGRPDAAPPSAPAAEGRGEGDAEGATVEGEAPPESGRLARTQPADAPPPSRGDPVVPTAPPPAAPSPEAAPPAPAASGAPGARLRGGRRGGGAAPTLTSGPVRAGEVEANSEMGRSGPANELAEDLQWLRYSDSARDGAGFIPWTPFDHPTLGPVEIGGFVPLFRSTPPAAELEGLAAKHAAFILELVDRLPTWTIEGPEVEALSSGVHRIRLAIRNDGRLPTHTALGRREGIGEPLVIQLALPAEATLAGRRVERVRGLEAGATQRMEWLVRGVAGDRVPIQVRVPGSPQRTLEALLVEPAADATRPEGSTP